MWGVKRMANQQTAGIFHLERLFGSGLRRTGREQQRVCLNMLLDAGPQVLFELDAFGTVLLNEINTGHGAIQVGLEAKPSRQILGWASPSL